MWADRARFARGVALAKKGDFAGALVVYRNEAVKLLSHERKQELADVYLEFAKKYGLSVTLAEAMWEARRTFSRS